MATYYKHRQPGGVGSPTIIASGILPKETGNQTFLAKLSLFNRSTRQLVKRYNDTINYREREKYLVFNEYIEILKQIDEHH
ncbi:MAG: hypothetical protein IJX26_02260 [Clostridia bacterium]|nr:hypothetical protein [Clostridia bacterium]